MRGQDLGCVGSRQGGRAGFSVKDVGQVGAGEKEGEGEGGQGAKAGCRVWGASREGGQG